MTTIQMFKKFCKGEYGTGTRLVGRSTAGHKVHAEIVTNGVIKTLVWKGIAGPDISSCYEEIHITSFILSEYDWKKLVPKRRD